MRGFPTSTFICASRAPSPQRRAWCATLHRSSAVFDGRSIPLTSPPDTRSSRQGSPAFRSAARGRPSRRSGGRHAEPCRCGVLLAWRDSAWLPEGHGSVRRRLRDARAAPRDAKISRKGRGFARPEPHAREPRPRPGGALGFSRATAPATRCGRVLGAGRDGRGRSAGTPHRPRRGHEGPPRRAPPRRRRCARASCARRASRASSSTPSIVPVYDLGVDADGAPFFTMKRLRGLTLERDPRRAADGRAATRRSSYPRRKLLAAFSGVCLAVDFAHSRGVLHRDLKPANVMLGDFGEVYVLDWGLAKLERAARSRRRARMGGRSTSTDETITAAGRSSARRATWRPSRRAASIASSTRAATSTRSAPSSSSSSRSSRCTRGRDRGAMLDSTLDGRRRAAVGARARRATCRRSSRRSASRRRALEPARSLPDRARAARRGRALPRRRRTSSCAAASRRGTRAGRGEGRRWRSPAARGPRAPARRCSARSARRSRSIRPTSRAGDARRILTEPPREMPREVLAELDATAANAAPAAAARGHPRRAARHGDSDARGRGVAGHPRVAGLRLHPGLHGPGGADEVHRGAPRPPPVRRVVRLRRVRLQRAQLPVHRARLRPAALHADAPRDLHVRQFVHVPDGLPRRRRRHRLRRGAGRRVDRVLGHPAPLVRVHGRRDGHPAPGRRALEGPDDHGADADHPVHACRAGVHDGPAPARAPRRGATRVPAGVAAPPAPAGAGQSGAVTRPTPEPITSRRPRRPRTEG